jgi:hypothetical protein
VIAKQHEEEEEEEDEEEEDICGVLRAIKETS